MNINSSTTTPEIRAYIKAQAVKTAVSLAKEKKVTEAEVMFSSSVLDWISSTAEVGDRDIDALNMVIEKRFAAENYNFCSKSIEGYGQLVLDLSPLKEFPAEDRGKECLRFLKKRVCYQTRSLETLKTTVELIHNKELFWRSVIHLDALGCEEFHEKIAECDADRLETMFESERTGQKWALHKMDTVGDIDTDGMTDWEVGRASHKYKEEVEAEGSEGVMKGFGDSIKNSYDIRKSLIEVVKNLL